MPCLLLFIVLPENIVILFLGSKWMEMIQPLRILVLFIFLRSLTAPFFECYKAKRILKVRIVISAAALGSLFPLLWLGCRFGITGVVLAHLVLFLAVKGIVPRGIQFYHHTVVGISIFAAGIYYLYYIKIIRAKAR